ncbi:MAG TPA: FtsX-like permease family protein, partial [Streptosporangiaceae bacterium]
PRGSEPAAAWLGTLTAVAALTGVPLLAVRQARRGGAGAGRADSQPSRLSRARRLVLDATLVLAAAGGLAVLRQQGTPRPGQTDWFTSAAAVLVAVPVAVLIVRVYPVAAGGLVRLTGRRRGVTTFVGLARAARSSATAALPAFALVLVLTLIAFGATLRAAVVRGDAAATWRSTGADVVVDATLSDNPVTPSVQRAFARVPGVLRLAVTGELPGSASDGTPLSVVLVDPAAYAALIGATPQPRFPAGALARDSGAAPPGRLPVLMSRGALAALHRSGSLQIGARSVPVRYAGRIAAVPGSGAAAPLVVAPLGAMAGLVGASEASPDRILLVGPHIDAARVSALARRLLPAATVTLRSRRLTALTAAPLPHGTYVAFAEGAAAAAGFGVVVLLIMLALGARSRELTLARLFTMGLSPPQARRLVITEALPVLVAAAAGGAISAWLLVPLIGPVLDLSPLTGSTAPVPVRADYLVLGAAAVALLVLAVLTLIVQSAVTRIRGVARALRIGE